ncbi:MAG: deoxyguanosinetriphosphate triphosphohydrolase [Lachnospiraceae bacterium]
MTIRETLEEWEYEYLSPFAAHSRESAGRDREEPQCDIRPVYQRDRDRILHCKSFRRMKQKTQVFLAPEGDHYRTRLTHTLEVSQNARTIAKALRLNEDLVEAIALGHDLGHTPFGHSGEAALNEICSLGFEHHKQSIRVVEFLEKKGNGLNLTKEVRDGILNHQTVGHPSTLEGQIVRLSDKIAYINHDIDDAVRGKVLREEDLPRQYTDVLGKSNRSRLNNMIHDIVSNSTGKDKICMSPEMQEAMTGLRKFMFDHVYQNPTAKSQEKKAQHMLQELFSYYNRHLHELPEEYIGYIEQRGEHPERVVCDYVAGMTDSFAIRKFEELYIPHAWSV